MKKLIAKIHSDEKYVIFMTVTVKREDVGMFVFIEFVLQKKKITADVLLLRDNCRPVRRVRATEDIVKMVWWMLPLSSCSLYLASPDFHPFWSC